MDVNRSPVAIVVGASSGIGEALAHVLVAERWFVGLAARRTNKLQALADQLGPQAALCTLDLAHAEGARVKLEHFIQHLGQVDLVVISAGTGHVNECLDWRLDEETIAVNAMGFAAVAQVAMEHFVSVGGGHLVGVSSIAKLRANGGAAAYCASKAFVSTYLDGLKDLVRRQKMPITVTEVCPGFVDTAMLKASRPFWVATPDKAARCIYKAIQRRSKHAYVTGRWGVIAALLRILPSPG